MSNFDGIFKDEIVKFIEYKRKNGFYLNKNSIYKMSFFDKYTVSKKIETKELTKEIVIGFLDGIKSGNNTKNTYASMLRQFAIYLDINGIKAYLLPEKYYPKKYDFIPHIFTDDEIKRLFEAINNSFLKNNLKKQEQIRIMFKLLFCTGMRISEVTNLKRNNINYDNNSILIEETKNGCDRLIVIGDNLIKELKYFEVKYNNDYIYYFENEIRKKYNPDCIYSIFRILLFKAKIMRTENGPRLHDMRHTFIVNSFNKAVKDNKDLNTFLPILSTYVGHKSIKSTYKYLRLTVEMYPEIREKINKYININKEINYDEF